MIAFRCSRCFKINISIEGHPCMHCGNETQVSPIPENQTEASTSGHSNNASLNTQNKSSVSDFNVLSQVSEKLNAAKLPASSKKEKDTETRNTNFSHILLSQEPVRLGTRESENLNTARLPASSQKEKNTETRNTNFSHISLSHESVRPVAQNSNLKETLISPCPTACSTFCRVDDGENYPSTKCGANELTKKLQHISEQSSFLESNTKDDIVNQLKGKRKTNKRSRKSNSTSKNILQDDLRITSAFSQHSTCFPREDSSKECIKNVLKDKMPIDRIKTPILKKPFLCNKCGRTFTDKSKLKVHFLYHFKEKRFKCDKCNKAYFSEAHLKRHYKSHLDKGPFKCELCDLVFNRNCHLSLHLKKHILEPCLSVDTSTAQQKMAQSSQLREQEISGDGSPQKHFQTLTEENFFLCTECGLKWARESDFHAHSLRHSVQNPFKCKKCNKEFRYELDLNRHCRVHSQERPFTCKICSFSSALETNLKKHLEIHA